jgi:glycosyltransferase involved in cell wall biosynthesis
MRDSIKKPRVMSFTHYGELYGANRSLLTLLIALKDSIDWWVISKENSEFTEELAKHNIRFSIVPFTNDVYNVEKRFQIYHSVKRFLYNIPLAFYLAYLIFKNKVDVIHSNSSVIFIGAMASMVSFRKHIWHVREFVYEDYNLKYLLGKGAFKFWAKKAQTIVCISESIRQRRIINAGIKNNSKVIYNGLVHGNQTSVPKVGIKGTPILGIVGVIDPAKDQLTAIKAVNRLVKNGKPVILRIIGNVSSNEYFQTLTEYVAKEKLSECVQFVGFSKNISSIFKELDISLMCSQNEALGRVTIESMMYGVPVVAYGSSGTMEIIEPEQTGLLYFGQEESLALQIDRLINDPDLYKNISRQGIQHVSQTFTVETYASKFLQEVMLCTGQ